MRWRLAEKQIGAKRQFLRELLNEVRVRGSNITQPLSCLWRLLSGGGFYTTKVVEAVRQCKEPPYRFLSR